MTRGARSLGRIFTVGAGGALAQGINVLAIPVIARLYTPESYGLWALVMSVVVIVASVASLRYELAIVLATSEREATSLLWVCWVTAAAMAVLATLAVAAGGSLLLGPATAAAVREWLPVVPILIVSTGVYQACTSWFTRTQSFAVLAAAAILLALLTSAGQIGAALLGFPGASGLIYGNVAGQLGAAAVLVGVIALRHGRALVTGPSGPIIAGALRRYRNFPLYMTPYALVGILRQRIVLFLLDAFGARTDVGYYAFSARLVNLPIGLASDGIRPVLFQRASVSERGAVEGPVVRLMLLVAGCSTPAFVLFVFHAGRLFALAFGREWTDAGEYALLLAIPGFVLLHTNWLDRLLDVAGRQRLALAMESSFSVASIAGFVIGLVGYQSVRFAVALQAAVLLVYNVVWVVVAFRVLGFGLAELGRVARRVAGLAAGSAVLLWALERVLAVEWAVGFYGALAMLYAIRTLVAERQALEEYGRAVA